MHTITDDEHIDFGAITSAVASIQGSSDVEVAAPRTESRVSIVEWEDSPVCHFTPFYVV